MAWPEPFAGLQGFPALRIHHDIHHQFVSRGQQVFWILELKTRRLFAQAAGPRGTPVERIRSGLKAVPFHPGVPGHQDRADRSEPQPLRRRQAFEFLPLG
jgi:hypothetical protein